MCETRSVSCRQGAGPLAPVNRTRDAAVTCRVGGSGGDMTEPEQPGRFVRFRAGAQRFGGYLAAMVGGPFAAYLLKLFDRHVGSKVGAGFKMLVDNYSIGVLGGVLAVLGMLTVGPALQWVTGWLGHGVDYLVHVRLLPLASII